MGKHASIQRSSTTRLVIRLFVLMLLVPAITVGCRGPWFQKTESFDPLIVTEKGEARTPRAFASSRLRPSTEGNATNTAPNPNSASQRISDDSDDTSLGELLQDQLEAMENMRTKNAIEHEDLLADEGPKNEKEDAPNFKMSDEAESSTFESEAQKPSRKKAKAKQQSDANETKPKDPPAKSPANDEPSQPPTLRPREKSKITKNDPPASKEVTRIPDSDDMKSQVVIAGTTEDVDATAESMIKIETSKSDWRVLASETLAALQADSGSEVVLSPDQRLSIEAKKRMLSLILDDLDGAMTPIENLQAHEQEFFQHEFQAIHAATDPKGNPVLNRRWTLALESHRKAQSSLAAVSNLEIHNATFCTEVDSFGILNKFPQYHFRQNQELLLYCELDNFVSTPVKDGFETQLQGSYEILDSSGRRVADQLLPPDEHICRNQRRDYFIAYRIYTPQDIKPGKYTLKLTIEDMKGHKFGQTNVEFQVIQ